MLETTIEWIFVALALVSYYVTYVHFKWWRAYRPSPLIRHLLIASIVIDVGATLTAGLALVMALGTDVSRDIRVVIVSMALFIGIGVKVFRRFDLRALDHPEDMDVVQRVETQNQREDRQFGEARRGLEAQHIVDEAKNGANKKQEMA